MSCPSPTRRVARFLSWNELLITSSTSRSRTRRCKHVSLRQRWKCRDSALSTRKSPLVVQSCQGATGWTNDRFPLPQTTDLPNTRGIALPRSGAKTPHERTRVRQRPNRTINSLALFHLRHKVLEALPVYSISRFPVYCSRYPPNSRCIYSSILWTRTKVKKDYGGERLWVCRCRPVLSVKAWVVGDEDVRDRLR